MCLDIASTGAIRNDDGRTMTYVYDVMEEAANAIEQKKRLSPETVKLLNVWQRRRNDLRKFVRTFKSIEGEREDISYAPYQGRFYHPYLFFDRLLEMLV